MESLSENELEQLLYEDIMEFVSALNDSFIDNENIKKLVLVLMNKNSMLKSLFKVKRHGFEDEQAKLDRYYKYFAKMDKKQSDLIHDIYAKCSENPSIDVDLKSMVDNLYELSVGDVNG